jgi:SAM-dependent methyltransferase
LRPIHNQLSWEASIRWLKAQPGNNELVQACFFDDPLSAAANRYYSCSEWEAVRRLLGSQRGLALDLGSGRGISAYALAKDGWQTTALEPDPSEEVGAGAIRRLAVETRTPIKVVERWGEELPFESNSFDLVHCRQVLHHARDLALLCGEAARVLKPNGIFLATREHVLSRSEDLQLFFEGHPLHRLYRGEHAFLLSEYTSAINAAGIQLIKTFNPLESDINLFPASKVELKAQIARRLFLPFPNLIPDWLLSLRGRTMDGAGRLYSFLGRKKPCTFSQTSGRD